MEENMEHQDGKVLSSTQNKYQHICRYYTGKNNKMVLGKAEQC